MLVEVLANSNLPFFLCHYVSSGILLGLLTSSPLLFRWRRAERSLLYLNLFGNRFGKTPRKQSFITIFHQHFSSPICRKVRYSATSNLFLWLLKDANNSLYGKGGFCVSFSNANNTQVHKWSIFNAFWKKSCMSLRLRSYIEKQNQDATWNYICGQSNAQCQVCKHELTKKHGLSILWEAKLRIWLQQSP